MRRSTSILALALFSFAPCTFAQTGFPPFASIERSGFDARNDQNMNVNFSLPIMASPGRGMTLNLSAFYNSLTWVPKNIAGTIYWSIAPQGNFGWQLNSPVGNISYQYSSTRTRCGFVDGVATYTYVYTYDYYVYVDPYGTRHTFNIYQQETVNDCTGSDTFQGTYTGYGNDLSGLFASIVVDPTNPVVTTKSGIAITNTTQTDTNGNYISSSSPSGETDWTDSAGRLALKIIGGNTSTQDKFYDPTGTYQTTTVNFQTFNIKTNFGCSGIVEYNNTGVLPVSLVLPNNQTYQFAYEPTPGNSGYYTGRLQRITLPTGGYYEYDYTGANDGINCADGTTLSMNRVVSDGTNTATWSFVRNTTNLTTTITTPKLADTPNANDTVITFNSSGQETSRKIYANSPGSGTPLRTINPTWAANGTPATQVTILDDGSTQSEVANTYDSNGLLDSVSEYGFGTGVPGGLFRTTTYTYQTSTNYTNRNILDLVTSKQIKDGSSTVQYRQDIAYDATSGDNQNCPSGAPQHLDASYGCSFYYRGNPTSVTTYLTPSTPANGVTGNFTYDWFGNLLTASDPLNNRTTLGYSDSWVNTSCAPTSNTYAYVTSVTNALSQTGSYKYYACVGLVGSIMDPNNRTTTLSYDVLRRPVEEDFPDGGKTLWTYNSATSARTQVLMNTSPQYITVTTLLDGLGRTKQTQLNSDPEGVDYVDSVYDLASYLVSVSNPYRTTSDPTYGITSYKYDVLGRPTTITLQDGSVASVSYSTNTVTAADPASKTRQTTVDAFGRLTQVIEDPGSGGHLNYVTNYTYDILSNLISVVQNGSRQRTFTYDALSRLLCEANPEIQIATCPNPDNGSYTAGTIRYGYDNNGNLTSRQAPAPNQTGSATVTTTYSWDALHRLTQKSYSDSTTLTAYFAYEQTSAWGTTLTNTVGRLTEEWTGTSCCATGGAEIFGYDPMGRIIINEQYTATMGYRPMNYTYDLAGNLATYTDGVGETYTQTFDAASRATQLNSSWVDSQHPATMLSGISYNPGNAMTKLTYGNGLTQTAAFNNALQPCRVNLNSSGTALGTCTDAIPSGNVQDFNYSFNAGSSDNGNVASWTATGQRAFNRSFTYDSINRLGTLNQSSGNASACSSTFSLSWNYDAWGNRTDQNVTGGACNGFHATVNSKNQLSGSPYQYDAAGNMTNDGNHTYFYDAENRLVQVGGTFGTCSTATACYLYDALGRRTTKSVGAAQTNYIYGMDGNVISEVDQNNVWMNVYLRMNGQFIAQYLIGSPRTQFILTDHLGSARVLTKYDGTLVDSLDFLPFGEQLAGGNTTTHKFTGLERDSESGAGGSAGLDHTWFRQYSSQLGRWIHPDPAGLASVDPSNPETWNRYTYASNRPTYLVDPSGLCDVIVGGFTQTPGTANTETQQFLATQIAANQAYPYSGLNFPQSFAAAYDSVSPVVAADAILDAADQSGGQPFTIYAFSGGAQAVANAWPSLPQRVQSQATVVYISPGRVPFGNSLPPGQIYQGHGPVDSLFTGLSPNGSLTECGHSANCEFGALSDTILHGNPYAGRVPQACKVPTVFTRSNSGGGGGGGGRNGSGGAGTSGQWQGGGLPDMGGPDIEEVCSFVGNKGTCTIHVSQ